MILQYIFNLLSLFYLFRAAQVVMEVWRKWDTLWQEPLTRQKWGLANRASFFISVPPAVLLHEFGHALAVWLFGGQVVQFAYRVFWGFVVPAGTFTAAEDWFISLAGTLGNLFFGVVVWLLLRRSRSSTMRYFGLQTFHFQLYFAFVYYPIFTPLLGVGDWFTIYNFEATPILSGITAVFHVAILLGFWQAWRQGWFELPTHETVEAQQQFAQRAAQAQANPQDLQAQLLYAAGLRRGLATRKAQWLLQRLAADFPDAGAVWIQLAALGRRADGAVTKQGAMQAEKALALGLPRPESRLFAHLLLGQYALALEKTETAVSHLTHAIAEANQLPPSPGQQQQLAELHCLRAQAHRRLEQFEAGLADVETAVSNTPDTPDNPLLAQLTLERRLIQEHPKYHPPT